MVKLLNLFCKNDQKNSRTFLYYTHQTKSNYDNVDMKLSVRMPEKIIAACILLPTHQHLVKMDLIWKALNISQQITTFATQTDLLTYHGKYI